MEFEFKISHKPEKSHCGADFLSRSTDGNELESLRDEPVDAELFQTAVAVEELDPEWLEVQDFLQTGKFPEDWSQSRKKGLIVKSLKFTIIGSSLYRLGIDGVLRRCVPISARMQIITEAHNGSSGGHFSSDITYKKILQAGLWWQSVMVVVRTYCKTCDICQRMGRPTAADMTPLTTIQPLEVHGDTVFVTGIFTPFQAGESSGLWDEQGVIAATAEYLSSQQQSSSKGAKELAGNNSDFDLAVSLQNEEFESQQQQHHQQARITPVSARQSQTVDSTMRADGSRLITGPKKGNYYYKPETKSKCAIM
ncbi:hypothetical protein L7F22_061323 [Adiantum nelumboides]|nr:hypothetical protein [Adiantum nelumboides]